MFTVMTATAGGACVGEAHIVTVSGEASGETWKELDLAGRAVHEGGGQRVVVDLSGLSAGGGDVVLAHPGKPASTAGLRIERRVNDAVASLLA
jgi:hypothetical protein